MVVLREVIGAVNSYTNKTPTLHELKHYTPTNHDNVNLYDISYKKYIATVYPSLQDTIPHAVNPSLTLLKMSKMMTETC
jgi:hypothetical protein